MSRLGLNARVNKMFDDKQKSSVYGLALLVEVMTYTAEHRNWDALSTFITRAKRSGQEARVKNIIRLAFGDKLTYKTNAKHATGGEFVMNWQGALNLRANNMFASALADAQAAGEGWDSKAFSQAINKLAPPKADKPVTQKTKEETVKKANLLLKSLEDAAAQGYSKAELLALVNKAVANSVVKLID